MRPSDQLGLDADFAPCRDHRGTHRSRPLARRNREDRRAGARQRGPKRTGVLRRPDDRIVTGNTRAAEWHMQHIIERRAEQRAIAARQPLHQRGRSARRQHRIAVRQCLWQ